MSMIYETSSALIMVAALVLSGCITPEDEPGGDLLTLRGFYDQSADSEDWGPAFEPGTSAQGLWFSARVLSLHGDPSWVDGEYCERDYESERNGQPDCSKLDGNEGPFRLAAIEEEFQLFPVGEDGTVQLRLPTDVELSIRLQGTNGKASSELNSMRISNPCENEPDHRNEFVESTMVDSTGVAGDDPGSLHVENGGRVDFAFYVYCTNLTG